MTSKEKRKTRIINALKSFFTKNIALKVSALVFAMLLWGYVLTDQKPLRTKTVTDVSTSFDGEAELLAQSLCVRGNRSDILQSVTVKVRTQITNYADLSNKSVNATISLRNISEARVYELPIQATVASGLGTVSAITPGTVKVEIDQVRTKTIPVTTSFTGQLADGYWADMDAISSTTKLDISGARTDIAKVNRAECIIDLTGRTSTIYGTYDVVLYDETNNVISSDIVIGTLPSSTVRLPIYPMRNVPIDVLGSLVGTDNLAANHELVSAVATPSTVRIVASSESALNAVETISLEPIAVNGMNAAATVEGTIILPEGVRVLDTEPVSVLIDVRETIQTKTIEKLPITIKGKQLHTDVMLDLETVDLTIEGRVSIVSLINRSDVDVSVDVTNLEPGTYTLELSPFVRNEATTVELTTTLSTPKVQVTVTAAP